jgi:hypothetical protein
MNELIEKLWVQAGGHHNSGNQHTWPQYTIDDPAKFAELIVRECADIATIHQQNHAHDSIGRYVLDHFGVAEREDPVQDPNLHTCPYAEEIHGDYETLCDCDEERTRQCAQSI